MIFTCLFIVAVLAIGYVAFGKDDWEDKWRG
jgi:hypothetical protein